MKLSARKPIRLKKYDYSRSAAYFVTFCTKNREHLLGKVAPVGAATCRPHVMLSKSGILLNESIQLVRSIYPNANIKHYIIMPNHVHMIIEIISRRQVAAPTISLIVGNIKRHVSVCAGQSIWQKSFHDHIIRDGISYRHIRKYIHDNPALWEQDCYYTKH